LTDSGTRCIVERIIPPPFQPWPIHRTLRRGIAKLPGEGEIESKPTGILLRVRGLSVRFGGIVALEEVSFDVPAGAIVGLIGPNGAGKTTLFNCLSRLYTPTAGSIEFDGRPLLALPAHRIAGLGIGRTFQNLALFPTLSVLQNVMTRARRCACRGCAGRRLARDGKRRS